MSTEAPAPMTVAQTLLPPEAYFEPAVYRQELERIVFRSWMHVCHVSQLPRQGDYCTAELGDQSIVVVRGENGTLRAFHNVCRHRASRLVEGSGSAKAIVCPYHGWTYHTDGSLIHARGSEHVTGFDRRRICLEAVRLDTLAGFVFVNLDPAAEPLAAVYAGLEAELRHYEPGIEDLVHVRRTTFDLAVNWKIAVENYLEAYHLVQVHPALRNSVRNDQWQMTLHPRYTSLIGHAVREGETAYDFTRAERLGQTNWWVWPMVMFEQMPGGSQLFTYNHVPLGPERTLQIVDFYFPDASPSGEQRAEIEYIEQVVRLEDKTAIERVQRGLHSRGYRCGPLMVGPDMPEELTEKGIAHFQTLVASAMTP